MTRIGKTQNLQDDIISTTYLLHFNMFLRSVACSMAKWKWKTCNSFTLFLSLLLSFRRIVLLAVVNFIRFHRLFHLSMHAHRKWLCACTTHSKTIHRMSCDDSFFFLIHLSLSLSLYLSFLEHVFLCESIKIRIVIFISFVSR